MITLDRLITIFSALNGATQFTETPVRHQGVIIKSAINTLHANGVIATKAKMMDRTFTKIESSTCSSTTRNCFPNMNHLDETHSSEHLRKDIPAIEAQIDYTFKNKTLIDLAFIHSSYASANGNAIDRCNERLEFLGDKVLGLIVSDFLYSYLPDQLEGKLSYLHSCLVEASACTLYLKKIALERFLMVGKGEAMKEGKGRETILADLFEAIMGALYLDGGMEAARRFFFDHFEDVVLSMIEKPQRNWKAELQDYCQKSYQKPPEYTIFKEEGPEHLKNFMFKCI
ncbi:MAG: ribonuclease III [Simkaniaceae bacterium]|nr:ribonuclease III [Simkaniaceae bacterium]